MENNKKNRDPKKISPSSISDTGSDNESREYRAWQMAEVIRDLTLGNPPRHPADTPEKEVTIKRLQADIDEAKEKGYVIFTPD